MTEALIHFNGMTPATIDALIDDYLNSEAYRYGLEEIVDDSELDDIDIELEEIDEWSSTRETIVGLFCQVGAIVNLVRINRS